MKIGTQLKAPVGIITITDIIVSLNPITGEVECAAEWKKEDGTQHISPAENLLRRCEEIK